MSASAARARSPTNVPLLFRTMIAKLSTIVMFRPARLSGNHGQGFSRLELSRNEYLDTWINSVEFFGQPKRTYYLLLVKAVSCKYERMGQKEETNLIVVVVVYEVEVGTRELGLGDLPEPVHWRTKHDVRGIGWTRATGEEGNELVEGVDDDEPRVPAPGERTRVVVIVVNCRFH